MLEKHPSAASESPMPSPENTTETATLGSPPEAVEKPLPTTKSQLEVDMIFPS